VFFEQFYLQGLGHASYLVGSEETGEALLFDPQRDVSGYFDVARVHGLRIRHALDSHGHNDYLSGLTEVAERADVELLASAVAEVGFEHRPLRDGEQFELGEVGFEVLHTPGHTPEHISLVVYDRSTSADVPAMLLSGGALLVGDLARPDLLGGRDQAEAAAREFCRTIQTKILELPDHIEVFPTHVAGSLCGGNIGSRLSTTVGYERRTNEILARVSSKDEFVEQCLRLDNLPAVPPYWRRMRRQNLAGVAPLGVLGEPPALEPDAVLRAARDGAVVLDTRAPEAYGGGHIPGALNVGQGASFPTWAGTVLGGTPPSCWSSTHRPTCGPLPGTCCASATCFPSGGSPGGCWRGARRPWISSGSPRSPSTSSVAASPPACSTCSTSASRANGPTATSRAPRSSRAANCRSASTTCPAPTGPWRWCADRATGPPHRPASSTLAPISTSSMSLAG
jgi:glyoxylase-like metal-dependent hydrolase (beta-lactamase superfamily II)